MMSAMGTATAEKTLVPMSEVRAWAMNNGMDVNAAGNIPAAVVEAYNKAHRTKIFERRPASAAIETRGGRTGPRR
jgi:hypothetical protein